MPNTVSQASETYIPRTDEPENWRSSAILVRSRSVRSRRATIIDTPWYMTNASTPRTWSSFHQLYAIATSVRGWPLGLTKPAGQDRKHPGRDAGLLGDQSVERPLEDPDAQQWCRGHDRCRALAAVEERQLTEEVAGAERGQGSLLPGHPGLPLHDREEGSSPHPLDHDRLSGPELHLVGPIGHGAEVTTGQPGEQRDPGEEVQTPLAPWPIGSGP